MTCEAGSPTWALQVCFYAHGLVLMTAAANKDRVAPWQPSVRLTFQEIEHNTY